VEPLGVALDSHAEGALFERNASRVYGFCLSRLRRREDAEDALQTTFLHAFRSLRRGVVPLVESAWLIGIARNVCLERWEAAGRRNRVEASWDPVALDRTAPALNERTEDVLDLEDALTRLPAQQRRAVVLRDWRGLSYEEVAAELGVSHSAVETMIFRGRRTLAEYLRDGATATKRKLGSLLNLASLFSAVRAVFGGGATATKIATAVSLVVVSGSGLAVGEKALGDSSGPGRVPAATQRPAPAAAKPTPAPAHATPAKRSATRAVGRKASNPSAPPRKDHQVSPPDANAATGLQPPLTGPAAATPASSPAAAPWSDAKATGPIQKVVETAKKPATKVAPVLAEPVEAAGKAVAPVVGEVKEAVAPVVAPVVAAVAPVTAPVVAPVAPVVDPVVGTVGQATAPVAPVVDPVVGAVGDVVDPALPGLLP
jgi:RNA polymerase sigma-70 factor (ECF subfamily)